MVLGQPEWKKYKPTRVVPSYTHVGYYYDIPKTIPVPDVPTITGYKPRVDPSRRYGKFTAPTVYGVTDANRGDGRASIDRSAFFRAGKYPTYEGIPEYYQEKVHELPSREQFVSEGGLFGEPIITGEANDEGGLLDDAKGLFSLETLILVGGVILLCLLIFAT